jgi:predicted GH43/DUF377 family glycosyl hydrolase
MSFQPCRFESNWIGSVRFGINGLNVRVSPDIIEFYTDKQMIYNNGILMHDNKLYMTFRRSCDTWITELDESFNPLNPRLLLKNAEDARLFHLNGKMHCSYTSMEDNRPHMHVCRLESNIIKEDKHLLQRKHWEKNWQFFQTKDGIYCIYDYNPFTVFKFDSEFNLLDEIHRERPQSDCGELRGSTPPFMRNGLFHMLVHSRSEKYSNLLLLFDEDFNVKSVTPMEIEEGDVVFPCGFIPYKDKFMISYGYANKVAKIKIMTL